MLILTRKRNESIKIGGDILIKVVQTKSGLVKLGIEAPADVRVLRGELSEYETVASVSSKNPHVISQAPSQGELQAIQDCDCFCHFGGHNAAAVEDEMLCVATD